MKMITTFFCFVALLLLSTAQESSSASQEELICQRMRRRSDDIDGLLYMQAGLGGPLDPFRVDWAAVESYLAPGFVWNDNSLWPSRGNYTVYREYWVKRIANERHWPLVDVAVEVWRSCDPVGLREASLWEETFGSADNASVRVTSSSLYVTEFDPVFNITGNSYWTSGNLQLLVGSSPQTPSTDDPAPL